MRAPSQYEDSDMTAPDDLDDLTESYDCLEDVLDAALSDGEACYFCHGEGFYHDCGEDTCCCAHPEDDDLFECEECGGTGRL